MSEIGPQVETEAHQRPRIIWKPILALLIVGAAASGAFAHYSPQYPRARFMFEIFLGLLSGYAGANGIITGTSLNAFIVLPFVFTGSAKEEESPNTYAVSIIIFFIIGVALLAHAGWHLVRS